MSLHAAPRGRRAAIVATLVLVGFLVGFGFGSEGTTSRSLSRGISSPTAVPRTALSYLRYRPQTPRVPYDVALEPYDYYAPAPPLETTDIDGYYIRIVRLEEVGGPHWGLPIHCRRCPAYRVDPGVETLLLYRGRYWLEHQMSTWRAVGHYLVRRDRVSFFNDPNCSRIRGTYRWSKVATSLTFRVLEDVCPYEDERADDLTFSPWTRVRPCLSGIQYWWPALIGCKGGESGVRF